MLSARHDWDERICKMVCPSKLHLRILYTINSSPQYILARSHSAVTVNLISEPEVDVKQHPTRLKFATVSLKACLDTICRSSPELIQDNNRDYSVYVLDPLESGAAPAPMNISNSSNSSASTKAQDKKPEHPCGVAVGLGLMSWALQADGNDGAVVTGTQVRLGTGQGALEVIFALREVQNRPHFSYLLIAYNTFARLPQCKEHPCQQQCSPGPCL